MLSSFTISGFRCFGNLSVPLRRVNLVTGRNGSGKTTLLEALRLYADAGAWESLVEVMQERGEFRPGRDAWEAAKVFLVGHGEPGALDGRGPGRAGFSSPEFGKRELFLGWWGNGKFHSRLDRPDDGSAVHAYGVTNLRSDAEKPGAFAQLVQLNDPGGGWQGGQRPEPVLPRRLIPLVGLPNDRLFELWGGVEFTDAQDSVVGAMRALVPELERASFRLREDRNTSFPAVKLQGKDGAVPMAALGEGVQRVFALLCATWGARGGLLLVDEIDTGLHFRAQERVWQAVLDAAVKADVQVVATTHSADAVRALARAAAARAGEAQVIRLEASGGRRDAYTFADAAAWDMVLANELEVR